MLQLIQKVIRLRVSDMAIIRLSAPHHGRVRQPPIMMSFSCCSRYSPCYYDDGDFLLSSQRRRNPTATRSLLHHSNYYCYYYDPAVPSVRLFSSSGSRRRKKKLKPEEDPFFVLGFTTTASSQGHTNRVILHSQKHHHHRHHNHASSSPQIPFQQVKTRFLQIAMKHHPDTSKASTKEEEQADRDIFVKARKAFEALVEAPDGMAILRSESDQHAATQEEQEEDLSAWFQQETGHSMPFMDMATMKEVAEMTEKVGGEAGLDRDGGMWTLARMVSQSVKSGGGGADSLLQLEAGTNKLNREINGVLRRKRKR